VRFFSQDTRQLGLLVSYSHGSSDYDNDTSNHPSVGCFRILVSSRTAPGNGRPQSTQFPFGHWLILDTWKTTPQIEPSKSWKVFILPFKHHWRFRGYCISNPTMMYPYMYDKLNFTVVLGIMHALRPEQPRSGHKSLGHPCG
jgi:hypothetical protein